MRVRPERTHREGQRYGLPPRSGARQLAFLDTRMVVQRDVLLQGRITDPPACVELTLGWRRELHPLRTQAHRTRSELGAIARLNLGDPCLGSGLDRVGKEDDRRDAARSRRVRLEVEIKPAVGDGGGETSRVEQPVHVERPEVVIRLGLDSFKAEEVIGCAFWPHVVDPHLLAFGADAAALVMRGLATPVAAIRIHHPAMPDAIGDIDAEAVIAQLNRVLIEPGGKGVVTRGARIPTGMRQSGPIAVLAMDRGPGDGREAGKDRLIRWAQIEGEDAIGPRLLHQP